MGFTGAFLKLKSFWQAEVTGVPTPKCPHPLGGWDLISIFVKKGLWVTQSSSAVKWKVDSPAVCEGDDLSSRVCEDPRPAPSRCELLIEAPPVIQGFKETLEMAKPDPELRTDTTKLRTEATALLLECSSQWMSLTKREEWGGRVLCAMTHRPEIEWSCRRKRGFLDPPHGRQGTSHYRQNESLEKRFLSGVSLVNIIGFYWACTIN